MIRARAGGILILGLEAENVVRLKQGKPIHVHQVEVDNGEPITQVVIMYGDTPADLVEELKGAGLLPPDFVAPPVQSPRATKKIPRQVFATGGLV